MRSSRIAVAYAVAVAVALALALDSDERRSMVEIRARGRGREGSMPSPVLSGSEWKVKLGWVGVPVPVPAGVYHPRKPCAGRRDGRVGVLYMRAGSQEEPDGQGCSEGNGRAANNDWCEFRRFSAPR
ncbi:hypothetical protein B0T26DRAFT_480407 [Lasiosphaeria miniovina]|uniref:Uncharacterized protein n=1 Tax=Lasiosphaeria miniovina TaxID=1954250 RepID=A0AA40A0E4_9PEZI|nr:uncharacterized protein B0T26DRAFT_480407 [Lasiosphaeria miniovina]KAK0706934.1 hypothetical protein B0T26DRAFT_480407 [Lasiosphaeria miniovina]